MLGPWAWAVGQAWREPSVLVGARWMTNLVAKTLGGNDGNFIADTLVGLEVEGELWVVTPVQCRD